MDWALFVTKKVVSSFLYPVGTVLVCWIVGLVLWAAKPRSRAGFAFIALGGLWLLVMSMPATGYVMLRSLEVHAGPYADLQALARKNARFVVVLGGDVRTGDLTPADRVACSSLVRVVEGIRLWRGLPGAKLILSGGRYSPGMMSSADAMAAFARESGVPAESIVLESQSRDTREEAKLLKPILGQQPFALVTSASHMMRSLMDFRLEGLEPVPAPADFQATAFRMDFSSFLPGSRSLDMSRKAIHEYVGMLAILIRTSVLGRS
jgi:uncharacterized SAM-binding protein YcdF (DUF218 family)